MSANDRARGIGSANARARRRLRTGRVGEPNVLSNAATPNTLSTMISRPANVTTSPRPAPAGQAAGWLATGATASRQRVGLPSFGTLIFLVFLAITGVRLIGEFVRGLDESPAASGSAPGTQATAPGTIIFGIAPDGECGVLEASQQFAAGVEVWWTALLASEQPPGTEAVVIVRRDGIEIYREAVPGDAAVGTWSVLCSGSPVKETQPGRYEVEVWDTTISTRHAIGEYRLASG